MIMGTMLNCFIGRFWVSLPYTQLVWLKDLHYPSWYTNAFKHPSNHPCTDQAFGKEVNAGIIAVWML